MKHLSDEEKLHFGEWIATQTKHAADRVLRRYRNGAIIGFLILALGCGYSISYSNNRFDSTVNQITQSRREQTAVGCARDARTIRAVRAILIQAETRFGGSSTDFYKGALHSLKMPDCVAQVKAVENPPK